MKIYRFKLTIGHDEKLVSIGVNKFKDKYFDVSMSNKSGKNVVGYLFGHSILSPLDKYDQQIENNILNARTTFGSKHNKHMSVLPVELDGKSLNETLVMQYLRNVVIKGTLLNIKEYSDLTIANIEYEPITLVEILEEKIAMAE